MTFLINFSYDTTKLITVKLRYPQVLSINPRYFVPHFEDIKFGSDLALGGKICASQDSDCESIAYVINNF